MKRLACRLLAVALVGAAILSPTTAQAAPHKPCEYEDSVRCVWDARHMGNGGGKSFIRKGDGTIVYVSHKRAHRLIFGGDTPEGS